MTRAAQDPQSIVGTSKVTLLKLPACSAELPVTDLVAEPEAGLAAHPTTKGTTTRATAIRRHVLFAVDPIYSGTSCYRVTEAASYKGAMALELAS